MEKLLNNVKEAEQRLVASIAHANGMYEMLLFVALLC
jgi:hypothetical protein